MLHFVGIKLKAITSKLKNISKKFYFILRGSECEYPDLLCGSMPMSFKKFEWAFEEQNIKLYYLLSSV